MSRKQVPWRDYMAPRASAAAGPDYMSGGERQLPPRPVPGASRPPGAIVNTVDHVTAGNPGGESQNGAPTSLQAAGDGGAPTLQP